MEKYLGIDVGTTSIKGLVVDENGRLLDNYSWPLKMDIPKPGWAEQDPPNLWWEGVLEILRNVSLNILYLLLVFQAKCIV